MTFFSRWNVTGRIFLAIFLFLPLLVFSDERDLEEEEEQVLSIRPFGMGSYEFGQIVKGQYAHAEIPEGRLDHYWQQQLLVQVGLRTTRRHGFQVVISGEGALYFPYTLPGDGATFGYELLGPQFKYYPHHVEGSFEAGDPERARLYVGVGYFPYKYNPDGTNFGDYLHRVNSYPQFLPTQFDTPYQRLLGLRIKGTFFSSLNVEALLTSEVQLWPMRDYSPSLMVDYNLMDIFEAGAGIIGYRLFSVDEHITSPPPESQQPAGTDFSFASTKVIGRLAINPKALFPSLDIFGKKDLRIYSEVCLNGLKNYPIDDTLNMNYPGYDDLAKRILILIGFNVPTFKILDVLSLEFEYWNNDFANSYWYPYPTGGGNQQNPNPWRYGHLGYHTDPYGPWHWSVYLKKTFFEHYKLKLQFSRDHTILQTSLTGRTNGDPQEAMDGLGNWMWMAKIEFGF
jgi:hypothetical protein